MRASGSGDVGTGFEGTAGRLEIGGEFGAGGAAMGGGAAGGSTSTYK